MRLAASRIGNHSEQSSRVVRSSQLQQGLRGHQPRFVPLRELRILIGKCGEALAGARNILVLVLRPRLRQQRKWRETPARRHRIRERDRAIVRVRLIRQLCRREPHLIGEAAVRRLSERLEPS